MALTAAHAASAIADGFTTKQFERYGHHEVESPWILGREPGVSRMVGVWGAEIVVETIIADRMRRSHTWLRRVYWIPQILSIGFHAQASIHNSTLH
jgi:hypothetical protein